MKRYFSWVGMAAVVLGLAMSCAKKTPEERLQDASDAYRKRDPLGAIVLANSILDEVTTGPVALQARGLLVECYLTDGNFVQARRVLNEIIDAVGLNSQEGQAAAFYKLQTYEATRDAVHAREQVVNFLEGATTGTTFWAQLKLKHASYLLAEDQRSTAARILDEVFTNKEIEDEWLKSQAMNQLSLAYGTTETAKTGIDYFQSYLNDAPTTNLVPTVYMVMGHLSRILDEKKQADQYFEKGFTAFEGLYEEATGADRKIPILRQHARALSFKGDVDRAATLLNKGIEEFRSHPNRIDLHYELAQLYADNKQTTEAIEVCRNIAVEFHGDDRRVPALFMVGDVLLREKKYDEASEEYNSIAMLYPNTRNAYEAYMRMRRVEELRRRDAAASATLMFDLDATTPTAEGDVPTTGAPAPEAPTTGTTPAESAATSPPAGGR